MKISSLQVISMWQLSLALPRPIVDTVRCGHWFVRVYYFCAPFFVVCLFSIRCPYESAVILLMWFLVLANNASTIEHSNWEKRISDLSHIWCGRAKKCDESPVAYCWLDKKRKIFLLALRQSVHGQLDSMPWHYLNIWSAVAELLGYDESFQISF